MKHRKDVARIATAVERMARDTTARSTALDTIEGPHFPLALKFRRRFFVSDAKSAAAVEARRAFPIMGAVGPNGGGKSLMIVHTLLPDLLAGRKVLSTVRLLDEDGHPFPNYIPFTSFDQLIDARDTTIFADEMNGIAGAREAQRLDPRVQNVLVQQRRRNNTFLWSAPNWARADKIVREVTQAVTECRGFFADERVVRSDGLENATKLWAPKRLFTFNTYDTVEFEEWTAGKRDKQGKPLIREWFYGPGSAAFSAYDTLDTVSMVAGIQDNGRCDVCNGRISIPACKGHTDEERAEHRRAVEFADLDLVSV
jgi:hypothetical protein